MEALSPNSYCAEVYYQQSLDTYYICATKECLQISKTILQEYMHRIKD